MSADRLPVYTLAALALVGSAASSAGQDAAAVEAFLRRCEAARPAAIAEAKTKHEAARKSLAAAQQGVVNRQLAKAEPLPNGRLGFPSTKAKADAVADASANAKAAKELLDGLTRGDELPVAKLPGTWTVGDVGRVAIGNLDVVQVVDAKNVIASGALGDYVEAGQRGDAGQRVMLLPARRTVLLKGFAAGSVADDTRVNLAGLVVKVSGTTTYENGLGTTNTVPVVEPFDLAPVLKLWQERKAAK